MASDADHVKPLASKQLVYRGFTLIELLIVITVVAILATVSVVAYNGIQQRARDSLRASNISSILSAVSVEAATRGSYLFLRSNSSCGLATTMASSTSATLPINAYLNPGAPDWLGDATITGECMYSKFSDVTENEETGEWSVGVPADVPSPYASWEDFYDDYYSKLQAHNDANPAGDDWTDEDYMQSFQAFLAANPQFSCMDDGSSCETTQHTIPSNKFYKVDALYRVPEDACIPTEPPTGIRISYFSEVKNEWQPQQAGEGVISDVPC